MSPARLAGAVSWTLIDTWLGQALQLALFAVLAHLLSPRDFGVVAFAAVLVTFTRQLIGQGLSDVIVQRAILTRGHLDAAFWVAFLLSVILATAVALLAIPVADLLGEPGLTPVVQVLSLTIPLAPLSTIQMALLRRALELRRVAIRTLVAVSAGGAVGIVSALAGAGVWALVGQQVAFSGVSAVILWASSPWRPGLRLPRLELREIAGHSSNMVAADVITFLGRNVDNVIVGAWLGPVSLGLYSAGYRLLDVSHILLASVPRRILFPALARLQHDSVHLRQEYLGLCRVATSLALPAYVGLATLAPATVSLVLGTRWAESGAVAAVLLLGGPALFFGELANSLFQAVGRADRVRLVRTVWLTLVIAGAVGTVGHGIVAVAVAVAGAGYVVLPLLLVALRESVGVPMGALTRSLVPGIAVTFVVAGSMIGMQSALAYDANWFVVSCQAVAGASAWLLALRIADPATLRDVRAVTRRLFPFGTSPGSAATPRSTDG